MAKMPVEVVNIGTVSRAVVDQAVLVANSVQSEFVFSRLTDAEAQDFGSVPQLL